MSLAVAAPDRKAPDKRTVRRRLDKTLHDAQHRLAILEGRTPPERMADETDLAVQTEAREFTAFSHEQVRALILGAHEALERLNAGTYGVCIECDQKIGSRRLEALPTAPRCFTCQQNLEAAAGRAPWVIRDWNEYVNGGQ